jgi:hypothetical protein
LNKQHNKKHFTMKRSTLLLSIMMIFTVTGISAFAQPGGGMTIGGPVLTATKTTHDFGRIKKGSDASCIFTIKNTGDQPLIISNCQGSCGCTTPQCDKTPVLPGATNDIKVQYDSNRLGVFTKTVTVTWNSNDPGNSSTILTIKGEVYE